MSPEYGATMGYFPVDEQTMNYLRLIGVEDSRIQMIETYLRVQGLFRVYDGTQPDPDFSGDIIELNLSELVPAVAGPKRPHDYVEVADMQKDFRKCLTSAVGFKGFGIDDSKL